MTDSAPETPGRRIRHRSRSPSLRARLGVTLVVVSLLSVLLLGVFDYVAARRLLTESVETQLSAQQAAYARSIERGVSSIQDTVSVLAQNRAIIDALNAFSQDFDSVADGGPLLTPTQDAAVEEVYQNQVVTPVAQAGLDAPTANELMPNTGTGRYLQFHYIIENPHPPADRHLLVDAETDSSAYRSSHARLHPQLDRLRTLLDFGDLLLVDAAGNVVYSTDKRLDFGTNVVSGPHRASPLGVAVRRLSAVAAGEAVLVDFERYAPAGGVPSAFAAASVRDQGRTIGSLVVELPISVLNELTTAGRAWEETGLGLTGEVYVVGPDRLMRSDSRRWLEDPDGYVDALSSAGYSPDLARTVDFTGSTVLLQPVESGAVQQASEGERFVGTSANYLDESTLTAAGPIANAHLDWVVVADISQAEAGASLREYTRRIGLAGVVLLPLVGLVATLLARRMTRPVKPVVDASSRVASGDLDVELPDLGRNEIGDVARRLNILTRDLRSQRDAMQDQDQQIHDLLLSALPPRLIADLRSDQGATADLVETATIIAVSIEGLIGDAGIDADSALDLSGRVWQRLENLAEGIGIERVRASSEQHLFAAGLNSPDAAPSKAIAFAYAAAREVEDFAETTGVGVAYHAGVGSGEVISGLVNVGELTFGVFGDAPRLALALDAVASPGEVLVHTATAAAVGADWRLESVDGLIDLRGDAIPAHRLIGRRESTEPATDRS